LYPAISGSMQASFGGAVNRIVARVGGRGKCRVPWRGLRKIVPGVDRLARVAVAVERLLLPRRVQLRSQVPRCVDRFLAGEPPADIGGGSLLQLGSFRK
jgi:hypothetical protein